MHVHIHQAGDEILAGKVADLGSLGGEVLATSAILSPSIRTSTTPSSSTDGSTTWAFLRSKAIIGTSKQQIQDSHTHADTGVDLLQDDGALRVVGHIGVELNAAVDGPGWQIIASGFMSFSRSLVRPKSLWYSRIVGNGAPSRRSCCTRNM